MGKLLQIVSDRLKDDEEVVLIALKNDVAAIDYVSDRLKNNKKIAMMFVIQKD